MSNYAPRACADSARAETLAVRRAPLPAQRSSWNGDQNTVAMTGEGRDLKRFPLQKKLVMGTASDQLEREAERTAEQVVVPPRAAATESKPLAVHRFTGQAARNAGPVPASVGTALSGPGRPLEVSVRNDMEHRFGHDFSMVRVHSGLEAEKSADAVGAQAYTVGRDLVFGSGRYAPETHSGRRLIAHELTHVVQQVSSPAQSDPQAVLQRDLLEPARLGTVHENVRVSGPPRQIAGGGTASRRPWVDPSGTDGGTADLLFRQAYGFLDARDFDRAEPERTNDSNLDSDAVAMHHRVLARFSLISAALADSEIESRVGLFEPATIRHDRDYLRAWLDNFLPQMSDSEDFAIDNLNPAYVAMLDRLIDDTDVGPKIVTLGARQPGFTTGDGASRQIFVHRRVEEGPRRLTLIHELVHFYRHPVYAAWVAASQDPEFYNEGLTEWLARRVMTPDELSGRTEYQPRVDLVEQQIAAHVPEDDIVRAFFLGEVWRLETRSTEARSAFETSTGISDAAPEADQNAVSRSGPGIFQTVESGRHYRFLNLGFDDVKPKPEHVVVFKDVKSAEIDPDPAVRVRFVGHASSAGSLEVNQHLSRRRSVAFYQMARSEGLPPSRMLDANNPPHFGETQPTAVEEDAITRAMNRRAEMFLLRGGS